MNIKNFYNKITIIANKYETNKTLSLKRLIENIKEYYKNDSAFYLKITLFTIIFEGYYQNLHPNNASPLYSEVSELRRARWSKHYGIPTIAFLLSYKYEISQVTNFLKSSVFFDFTQWNVNKPNYYSLDKINSVLVSFFYLDYVHFPPQEREGHLIKTCNPTGGFVVAPIDTVSLQFLKYLSNLPPKNRTLLEIGTGYGAITLKALQMGAKVFSNDIDVNNLAIVRKRHAESGNFLTGETSTLKLLPAAFPDETSDIPCNFFDSIFISRVLHFFTGEKIEKAILALKSYLKPGGLIFIICETPFLKNWTKFLPIYKKRVAEGCCWPGEINNPKKYETTGRANKLPEFIHFMTEEVLTRVLKKENFNIKFISYLDRQGQFPEDLLLGGKESIGVIAEKPWK